MAATDGQITVAAARWAPEGNYLREFVAKYRLPAVVKIIKGQYGGLGVPTLPSPGLQSTALLLSIGQRQKIEAQAVKIKEGRRLVCVGPRLAIPETYPGYFELLSEEGRAVKCIESVAELARRRPEEGFLVREPMRGVAAKTDLDGGVQPMGARAIAAGEILVPAGECCLPAATATTTTTITTTAATAAAARARYLKCTDSNGDLLLLAIEQRGKFSALAREDNISGVHTAKTLLSKRMPLSVRLVHGTAPRGLKTPSHFVPELRLLSIFEEEHVFALPLQTKDAQHVTALPLAAPLKIVRTKNDEQLKSMVEFERLVKKCARLVNEVADCIQVLGDGSKRPSPTIAQQQQPAPPPPMSAAGDPKNGFVLRRSASSDSANYRARHDQQQHRHGRDENRIPVHPKDYEEIDQIYDYVRGFAPLPKNIRLPFSDPPQAPASLDIKPEPPPIETIPTKKLQAEKRNRKGVTSTIREPNKLHLQQHHQLLQQQQQQHHQIVHEKTPPGLPKLYVKNSQSQRRLFRQKSASPMKETPPSPISKSGSPIFNIRYKSLSNLQQAMELDGTLDSSNSGGRASGDSGPGAKQPEKRSRKLSRPRSLTNLVWELREYPDISIVDKPKHPPPALIYKKHSKYPHKRGGALYL